MPLFHCIGLMAKVSIQEFQAQSLANVVQTFAQVQLNCGPFFETMNVQVARGICIDMEPQALANTAWALAQLQVVNDSMMASIGDGIRSRVSEFQLRELASAIWAFGELQLLDPPLFAAVCSASPGHESLRSSGVDQQANPVGFFLGFCPAHLQQLPFRIRCSEPCNSRPSVGQARKP